MEIQKKKYISPSINAGYFRECIFGYLKEAHQIPQSEVSFWKFIDTVKFENGMISRECRLFRELKEFADKHPINKSSLLWQRYFENADADFIRDILLYLKEEKEKRKEKRDERKSNLYSAITDRFNGFSRQYKYKLKLRGASDELLEKYEKQQNELQTRFKEKVNLYQECDSFFDDDFYNFFFDMETEVKRVADEMFKCLAVEVAV